MISDARYQHTNLVAEDWRALAKFYVELFGCEIVPPERELSGAGLVRLDGRVRKVVDVRCGRRWRRFRHGKRGH